MSFRWGEDTTIKFVTKYLEHECLWNVKSSLYKNKQIKQSAYVDLENAMNIPGFGEKEIKLKIKNIRSTYSQELKKIKESKSSGAGTDTVYVPSVKWFSSLDESLRNINSILTESESNLLGDGADPGHSQPNTYVEENSTATNTFREPTPTTSTPSVKRRKLSQLSTMVTQLKDISETVNSTTEGNEFEIFGQHIGLQLKSLPLLLALEAQEYIQLYINRIRREHLQKISHPVRSTGTHTPLSSEPDRSTTCTPMSACDSQDSLNNDNNYFEQQFSPQNQFTPIHEYDNDSGSSSRLPSYLFNIGTEQNATNTDNIIVAAMNTANIDY